jgi:DNA polymerase
VRFSHRDGTTVVTLPSGRELYYPGARVDSEGSCSYRWGYTYGGSLVENIVQAAARDVFTAGLLRIEDTGFILIGHIHDQAISLLPVDGTEHYRLAEMHRLQTEPLSWTEGLPVATEGELSKTYKKSEDE